jgi:anti-anti-sigma factor
MNVPPTQIHQLSSTPFDVRADVRGDRLTVELSGELDFACTEALEGVGHEDDPAVREVLVDTARLEFIDTAGAHALLTVLERHQKNGRNVRVVNPVRLVRKVLDLCGPVDLLDVG